MVKTTTYKPDTSFLQPGYFNGKKSFPLQVVTDVTAKEASYILDSYSHPSQPKSRKGSRVFARAFENGVYDYRLNPLTWAWVKSAKRLYLVNGHRRTSSILSAKVDSVKLSNQIIEVEDENELLDIFYKFDTELAKRTPTQLLEVYGALEDIHPKLYSKISATLRVFAFGYGGGKITGNHCVDFDAKYHEAAVLLSDTIMNSSNSLRYGRRPYSVPAWDILTNAAPFAALLEIVRSAPTEGAAFVKAIFDEDRNVLQAQLLNDRLIGLDAAIIKFKSKNTDSLKNTDNSHNASSIDGRYVVKLLEKAWNSYYAPRRRGAPMKSLTIDFVDFEKEPSFRGTNFHFKGMI